jgi:hypothetical protein
MTREKSFDLLKKILPVGIKCEKRIIEIPLENTIGAIHWTTGYRVDHMVSAANMKRSSWAGFQPPSIKTSKKETFLAVSLLSLPFDTTRALFSAFLLFFLADLQFSAKPGDEFQQVRQAAHLFHALHLVEKVSRSNFPFTSFF